MDAIVINAEISQDRRLIYELPPDVPVGPVKLVIQPIEEITAESLHLTPEQARAKLLAAGRLSTVRHAPEGATRSNEKESRRLARLFADDTQTTLDLINEDRGPKE